MNLIRIRWWTASLHPIRSESGDEFFPIDQTVAIPIKQIGHGSHFEARCVEFGVNDSINELVPLYKSVVVLVHLAEQVRETRLLVVHELQEPLSPIVPAEVRHSLKFAQVSETVV